MQLTSKEIALLIIVPVIVLVLIILVVILIVAFGPKAPTVNVRPMGNTTATGNAAGNANATRSTAGCNCGTNNNNMVAAAAGAAVGTMMNPAAGTTDAMSAEDYYDHDRQLVNVDPYQVMDITQTDNNDNDTVVVAIMHDGTFMVKCGPFSKGTSSKSYVENRCTDPLVRMVGFNGGIVGLSSTGILYRISVNNLGKYRKWEELHLTNGSEQITWISSSVHRGHTPQDVSHDVSSCDTASCDRNGQLLWINAGSNGYLYNSDLRLVNTFNNQNTKTILGTDYTNHATVNPTNNMMVVMPSGEMVPNVGGAVLNSQNDVMYVNTTPIVRDLRLIKDQPYYLLNRPLR